MDLLFNLSKILPIPVKKVIKPVINPLISWKHKEVRKKEVYKAYSKFVGHGDLVFDIGANVGEITEVCLELGARVVCVEPQPYCVNILKRKFGKNANVYIVEKGLGEKEGHLKLNVNELTPETSTFMKEWSNQERFTGQRWNKQVLVAVTTLDQLINKFGTPKFCKIDVEGFEYKVLRGLSKTIPLLSFEFTNIPNFWEQTELCVMHILSLGNYSFKYSLSDDYSLNPDRWMSASELFPKLRSYEEGTWGDIYAKLI